MQLSIFVGFNNLPKILRWVRVPAITNLLCNQQYTGSITNAMLCAGYPQGKALHLCVNIQLLGSISFSKQT